MPGAHSALLHLITYPPVPQTRRFAGRPGQQPQQQQQQPGLPQQSGQEEEHQVFNRTPLREEGEGPTQRSWQGLPQPRSVTPGLGFTPIQNELFAPTSIAVPGHIRALNVVFVYAPSWHSGGGELS